MEDLKSWGAIRLPKHATEDDILDLMREVRKRTTDLRLNLTATSAESDTLLSKLESKAIEKTSSLELDFGRFRQCYGAREFDAYKFPQYSYEDDDSEEPWGDKADHSNLRHFSISFRYDVDEDWGEICIADTARDMLRLGGPLCTYELRIDAGSEASVSNKLLMGMLRRCINSTIRRYRKSRDVGWLQIPKAESLPHVEQKQGESNEVSMQGTPAWSRL